MSIGLVYIAKRKFSACELGLDLNRSPIRHRQPDLVDLLIPNCDTPIRVRTTPHSNQAVNPLRSRMRMPGILSPQFHKVLR
jgi:hypothetical protein